MDFITEIRDAVRLGLAGFKDFIAKKQEEDDDYLEQLFWVDEEDSQITVLNYLLRIYKEQDVAEKSPETDILNFIDFVISITKFKNLGEPLHQIIAAKKIRLALHLLEVDCRSLEEEGGWEEVGYDVNRRDQEGRTLISLVLETKDPMLLEALFKYTVHVNAVSVMTEDHVLYQPVHQAVILDYPEGICMLMSKKAQLGNPVGVMKETPLLLAARLGKINAMEALLENSLDALKPEARNTNTLDDKNTGRTAMEELCERISNGNETEEAIRGVAMLLCRGAEPPASEEMRYLLSSNRIALLKAIDRYLTDKPDLVDAFVTRCHDAKNPIHGIVYANNSWSRSIRHFFGKPSDAAFIIENLVVRKHATPPPVDSPNSLPPSSKVAENFSQEKDPLKLYAEFVRRYTQAYDSQLIPNPWSTMRWMIADGEADWEKVNQYSKEYPTSRTRIILREMLMPPLPSYNADKDGEKAAVSAVSVS